MYLEFDHEKMTHNNQRDKRLMYKPNCQFNYGLVLNPEHHENYLQNLEFSFSLYYPM